MPFNYEEFEKQREAFEAMQAEQEANGDFNPEDLDEIGNFEDEEQTE